MTIADIKKTAETKMAKSIEAQARTAQDPHRPRPPGILDQVHVDYYGRWCPSARSPTSRCSTRTISVQPWEKGMGRQDREGDPRVRPRPEPVRAGRP